MGYVKRTMYVPKLETSQELIDLLIEKGNKPVRAREMVLYPRPLSLVAWNKYLDTVEMRDYLEIYVDTENESLGI